MSDTNKENNHNQVKRLTLDFVRRVYNATGVNIILLSGDEWRKINPTAQWMVIQEYLKQTHQMRGGDGIHIPTNYLDLLEEAINYFFQDLVPNDKVNGKKNI